jgi:hypothetical protein
LKCDTIHKRDGKVGAADYFKDANGQGQRIKDYLVERHQWMQASDISGGVWGEG